MTDYPSNEQDRIDRLKRGLYSRKTPDIIDQPRSEFNKPEADGISEGIGLDKGLGASGWQSSETSRFDILASKIAHGATSRHTFAKKLLLISSLLFIVSIGVAAVMFFGGMNLISSKNVDIRVVGPVSIGGGQNITFDVEVVNQNNTDLQGVKLKIEYPKGLRSVNDLNEELTSQSFDMGNIKSGETGRQKISAFIFGKKEEVKEFNLTVEYRVKNSSALFYKEKIHQVNIDSAPVIVNSSYPKEVNSNQEIDFSIEVASNSADTLDDFLVNVEYPFGFSFKDANPSATFVDNTWKMSLKSGEKRTIKIRGVIAGQNNEERVFKVNAGTASPNDERKIGVLFVSSLESILVQKPFIGVDLSISGSSGDYILSGSGGVNANLVIMNNLPERIFNTSIEASFGGAAFSKNSVVAGSGGFFRSIDNTILWDKRSISELGDLGPGEDVNMNFRLTPLSYQSIQNGSTPEIKMKVKVTGERILASGAVENIQSDEERTIKLATNFALNPKVVRSIGSLENSGLIPPKADKETTYTIVWSLSNSFNTGNNIEVKAVLPPYVRWTSQKSPSTEDIIFNPVNNEVVWRINQIAAGAGFKSPAKEVMFQVSFLPSVSQVGTAPEIVGVASIKGTDRVTGATITGTSPALTSSFASDPTFKEGYDKVVP